MEKRYDVSEVVEIPRKKKKSVIKKIFITFLILILVLIIAAVAGVFIYLHSLGITHVDTNNSNESNTGSSEYGELSDEKGETYYGTINTLSVSGSSDSELRGWYKNGESDLMNSRNVLNILIVGIDARDNSMQGNSDVMMLASINKKTGSITLCSFLRDSYAYFETSDGSGHYNKLNASYAYGGPDCLINAIENNFIIAIDYFVAVNFEAFESVVDAIGGVNVNVTREEAEAMEEYANITGVPYGENVHLNGEHALLFSRMRKIYATGDVQRTENQRKVINAIIKKSKTLGLKDLNKVLQTLGKYVTTDCPMTKIVTLGANAILGKWYDFKIYSMEAPPESAREAHNGAVWMWYVDYPYSAQFVQNQIYGDTNIVIQ